MGSGRHQWRSVPFSPSLVVHHLFDMRFWWHLCIEIFANFGSLLRGCELCRREPVDRFGRGQP